VHWGEGVRGSGGVERKASRPIAAQKCGRGVITIAKEGRRLGCDVATLLRKPKNILKAK